MSSTIQAYRGSNATIEKVALSFRQRMGIDPECRVGSSGRLADCVKQTGGQVRMLSSPAVYEAEGGSLVIRGPHDYTIFLSPFTTPLRDNFTIAHELGHFVLHYTPIRDELSATDLPLVFTRYGTGSLEWQANRFAAALLMPEESFRAAFRQFSGDLDLIAGHFGVSRPAAEIRCKNFGLS